MNGVLAYYGYRPIMLLNEGFGNPYPLWPENISSVLRNGIYSTIFMAEIN